MLIIMVGAITPWIYTLFLRDLAPGVGEIRQFIGGVVVCAGILAMFLPSFRRTRLVVARNGRVCLNCGFELKGLDDRGTCPECGTEYDVERNLRRFRPRYRWTLWWPGGRRK
jgi:hypothetical protein